MTIGIDIETYSSIDLMDAGVYRYTEAPDFTILLIGYCVDGGPVTVIDLVGGTNIGCLNEFLTMLTNPAVIKTAFNANFERTCLAKFFGRPMPPQEWRCTMVRALTCGLPGTLAEAGEALGLPADKLKDKRGAALIRYFSKPCKPTKANGGRTRNLPGHDPEAWQQYIEYNRQDVVTEQAILTRLQGYRIPDEEQALWTLDQEINDRGVGVDLAMIDRIVQYDALRKEQLTEEAKALTGLDNPNSVSQLRGWLEGQGLYTQSLDKETVGELLKDPVLPDKVRRVLEIRQALGKSSVAKYYTIRTAACEDGRVRGILQFYGANRSGRWAGRLVQIQNLARNSLPDLEEARRLAKEGRFDEMETLFGETAFVFSELVRTAFVPSEGCKFVVSDFSAIEARVISWIAGEEWRLEAFRAGKDIYCETASQMYHVPVVKHGVNGELRQRGKVAELACGYQGGVGAMRRMDTTGSIPEEELQSVVDNWRTANPHVVQLWRTYETAARRVIEEHRPLRLPHGITFTYVEGNLRIRLPSGRKLTYWGSRIRQDPVTGRGQIVYMGVNQTTRKWEETETYGGKLVENVVQAVARDCLAVAMTRVAAMGYRIVMHVHDEMIVDVSNEDTKALERINAAMAEPIDWAPGLPLKGDGYETPFYRKD